MFVDRRWKRNNFIFINFSMLNWKISIQFSNERIKKNNITKSSVIMMQKWNEMVIMVEIFFFQTPTPTTNVIQWIQFLLCSFYRIHFHLFILFFFLYVEYHHYHEVFDNLHPNEWMNEYTLFSLIVGLKFKFIPKKTFQFFSCS